MRDRKSQRRGLRVSWLPYHRRWNTHQALNIRAPSYTTRKGRRTYRGESRAQVKYIARRTSCAKASKRGGQSRNFMTRTRLAVKVAFRCWRQEALRSICVIHRWRLLIGRIDRGIRSLQTSSASWSKSTALNKPTIIRMNTSKTIKKIRHLITMSTLMIWTQTRAIWS